MFNFIINKMGEWAEKKRTRKQRILILVFGTLWGWLIIPAFFIFLCSKIDRTILNLPMKRLFDLFLASLSFAGGIYWTLSSILQLTKKGEGSFMPALSPTKRLVSSGVYSSCRNPMYLGYILLFAAVGLLLHSLSILFGVIPGIILWLFLYTRLIEDKVLEKRFGGDYLEYKKKTPFLIPFFSSVKKMKDRNKGITTIFLAVLVFVFFIISFFFGNAASPRSQLFGKIIWHGPTYKNNIALTFDDGPNPPYTLEILKILKKENVKATFFLIGKHVQEYPEIAKKIVREGHAIGNHTYTHRDLMVEDFSGIAQEIDKTTKVIEKVTGIHPFLFRPPRLWKRPEVLRIVEERGYLTMGFTNRSLDWKSPGVKKIIARSLRGLKNGSIICLHDGDGDHLDAQHSREQTVLALPTIIAKARAMGFKFVTIPELLDLPQNK